MHGIWYLGKGYTCIMLNSQIVRDNILWGGATIVNGAYVFGRPWGHDFDLNYASKLCHITINLFEVPMELRPVMKDLVNVFGEFLHVVEGNYFNPSPMIRAMALYDINKPIVQFVSYLVGSRKYNIKVQFLNIPNQCNQCHVIMHLYRECSIRLGEIVSNEVNLKDPSPKEVDSEI